MMHLLRPVQKAFDLLLTELRGIRVGVEKQTDAIDRNTQAHEQSTHAQPMIRAELHIPESEIEQKKSNQKHKKWLEWAQTAVQALTLLAVVYYACYARKQWQEMQKAERPWIAMIEFVSVEVESPTGVELPIPNTMKQTSLNIRYTVKNFGNSPAIHVWPEVYDPLWEDIDRPHTESNVARRQEEECRHAEMMMSGHKYGAIIFPQSDNLQEPAGKAIPNIPNNLRSQHGLHVTGCIVYYDQNGNVYSTRWCMNAAVADSIKTPIQLKSVLTAKSFRPCASNQYAE
jgi:hypothetical protein